MGIADVSPGAGCPRRIPRLRQTKLPWDSDEFVPPQSTHGIDGEPDGRRRRGAPTAPTPLPESAARMPAELPPASTRTPMLLTVRDVEAELQLGRTRTYELLRSGSIPVIRVGRALRVPRDALRRWVDEQTA